MSGKLTKAQIACLAGARRHSMPDNSGNGYPMYDRVQVAVAERLKAKGLVTTTVPMRGAAFGFVKITDSGRLALQNQNV